MLLPNLLEFKLDVTFKLLTQYFGETLKIFFLTLVLSLPLGMIVSLLRKSKLKPISWLTRLYISIMRGTPLMLQLIVVFYGPFYIFHIQLSTDYRFWAVIIGFVINYAAYFAEIYRGGIESIPKGQYEAAKLLGYSKPQTFIRIIMPQVIKTVLPSITNEIITLVKDTSLAYTLSYLEMFTKAKELMSSQASLGPLFVAGIFYYIMNFIVSFAMEHLEKKMDYNKRQPLPRKGTD